MLNKHNRNINDCGV